MKKASLLEAKGKLRNLLHWGTAFVLHPFMVGGSKPSCLEAGKNVDRAVSGACV